MGLRPGCCAEVLGNKRGRGAAGSQAQGVPGGLEELRGYPGESWRRVPEKKIILVCHG